MASYVGVIAMLQAEAEVIRQLERIALAQTVIAIAAAVILLIVIGGAIGAFLMIRSATRLLGEQVGPRVDALTERLTRIADDANDMTDSLRRKVHDVTATVEDLNHSLRLAGRAAEVRVRDFAAVIDVVQEEAESLLLDAAASARGVHTTAESLRDGPLRPIGRSRPRARSGPLAPRAPHEDAKDPDSTPPVADR